MHAKDMMVPLQEYLRPETTLHEAAKTLRIARRGEERIGVKGLPVLDEQRRMVGFLSIGDILKAVFPAYLGLMNLGDFTWDGMVESLACKARDKRVGEVMTRKVVTIPEEAPLMECVHHIIVSNVKRLPVVDREGKVLGILYERDLFYAISKAMDACEEGRCER